MNPEEIISKYLDGELSQDEDVLLRKLISEDISVREMFDTAVHIHLSVKEDAESIIPPKTLVNDTEDKILMKILASQPVSSDRVYKSRKVYALAAFAFLFLLASFLKIQDLSLLNHSFIAKKPVVAENKTDRNETGTKNQKKYGSAAKKAIGNHIIRLNDNNQFAVVTNDPAEVLTGNNYDKEKDVAASSNISEHNETSSVGNTNSITLSPDQGKDMNYSGNASMNNNISISNNEVAVAMQHNADDQTASEAKSVLSESSSLTDNLQQNTLRVEQRPIKIVQSNNILNNTIFGLSPFDLYGTHNEIQVTSFLGTDIYRGGIDTDDKTIVSHISQSLAYSISNKTRIGVEFGYTQYRVKDEMKLSVPLGDDIMESKHRQAKIEKVNPLPGTGLRTIVSYQFDRSQQMYWGAAFYERTLIEISDVSVNGRLGAGASADGFLGYSRLFAKYNLLGVFSLTLGTEGRIFSAEHKLDSDETNKLKTTFSLIYGFQLKF